MEPPSEITLEQIRERAYDLWERNHRPDGFEIAIWLTAERALKVERDRKLRVREADEAKSVPTSPEVQGRDESPA
ncbi:DUF2934 domain-containing protein [Methylorubrum extorquens]